MERYPCLEALPTGLAMATTIGTFDGVHRGHAALVRRLAREARARRVASVVVTFEPHPAAVLRGEPPALLCDPPERDARLAALGVDHLVVEPFDAVLADQPADTFLDRLVAGRRLAALLMTRGSAFGRGRGGTFEAMTTRGSKDGFDVVEMPLRTLGGEAVSSSRVRAAVAAGRLAEARRLLGRRHAVTGTVVAGDRRGRALGFPTANLAFKAPVMLPPDGIYAVRAAWGAGLPFEPAGIADGVASLGVRPTFGPGERVLEVYLLDTAVDLYGTQMRVEFVRRQRGERRFADADRLVAQMVRDVARARDLLATRAT